MISQKKASFLAAAALALVGLLNTEGRAESILARLTSVTPQGGNFAYVYDVRLTGNSQLQSSGGTGLGTAPADFFSFIDVAGFVSATGAANFTQVTEPVTAFPGIGVPLPTDSVAITNVRFNYAGPTILNDTNADLSLGTFTLVSSFNFAADGTRFIGQDRDGVSGSTRGNTDSVFVPTAPVGPMVPLPAPLLGGLSLFGLMALKKLRKPQVA